MMFKNYKIEQNYDRMMVLRTQIIKASRFQVEMKMPHFAHFNREFPY